MRRLALGATAVLLGSLVLTGAAVAATPETGPGTVACTEAGKQATRTTKNRDEAQKQVDLLKAELAIEEAKPDPKSGDVLVKIEELKDDLAKAEKRLGNKQILLDDALERQTAACTPPEEPTPEPDPIPPFVDLDCVDFPLADGRTAQQVLDETPGKDPHGIDFNGNRIACEVPAEDVEPDEDDPAPRVVVETPQGGVDTGGGPA